MNGWSETATHFFIKYINFRQLNECRFLHYREISEILEIIDVVSIII